MREKLSIFAKELYKDRERLIKELKKCVIKLKEKHPEIKEAILFGSIARGDYGLYSDADILLILEKSDKKRFFERISNYLDVDFPIPVDLFPYTEEEIKRVPIAKVALKEGVKLI